jgi:ubiquinone/menaquinone biosynthesis C-methylase UbiE
MALGASDFRDILAHWRHFGIKPGACVEIGCGAGRMTAQLATVFDTVVALDVSADQIKVARELLGPKASTVRFFRVDAATIPLRDASCAAMFSCHVFQHLPWMAGVVRYLEEAFRVLAPGGTVCFHIPVPGAHRGGKSSSRLRLALHNSLVVARRWLGARRIMEYHRYPAGKIFACLKTIGYQDAELRVFDMTSNRDAHSFFLARRP